MRPLLVLLITALLAACGDPKADAAPDEQPGEREPSMSVGGGEHDCQLPPERQQELMESGKMSGPPRPWEEMNHDDRFAYMAETVYPVMSEKFAAFDAERFADFSCDTCHGADAAERDYAMPSNDLMPLYPTGTEEQKKMLREMRPMATFMFSDVVPTMRTLLGQPEYDPETKTGFSCFACHPHGE